jgi:hypothetical protein
MSKLREYSACIGFGTGRHGPTPTHASENCQTNDLSRIAALEAADTVAMNTRQPNEPSKRLETNGTGGHPAIANHHVRSLASGPENCHKHSCTKRTQEVIENKEAPLRPNQQIRRPAESCQARRGVTICFLPSEPRKSLKTLEGGVPGCADTNACPSQAEICITPPHISCE